METRTYAYAAITRERERQEQLFPSHTCAWAISDWIKLAVLTEEVGEIARALNDGEPREHLLVEVTQAAAVLVAWMEALLDERGSDGVTQAS